MINLIILSKKNFNIIIIQTNIDQKFQRNQNVNVHHYENLQTQNRLNKNFIKIIILKKHAHQIRFPRNFSIRVRPEIRLLPAALTTKNPVIYFSRLVFNFERMSAF